MVVYGIKLPILRIKQIVFVEKQLTEVQEM